MDAWCAIGASRGVMDLTNALEQRRIALGVGRWSSAMPRVVPAGGTPSSRHIVATGYMARLALTNSKILTGSSRSPKRTRPRLLQESLALGAADGSHVCGGVARRAQRGLGHQPGDPHSDRPGQSNCESPERTVRTPEPIPPASGPIGPAQQSAPGIRVDKAVAYSRSWTPFSQLIRCPRKRVKSRLFYAAFLGVTIVASCSPFILRTRAAAVCPWDG